MTVKRALIYLDSGLNLVVKLLIGTLNYRKNILDEKIASRYFEQYDKIRMSSKSITKAIHNKSSFFDAFSSFLTKDESSSDEDSFEVLKKWENVNKVINTNLLSKLELKIAFT